jgi:two-component system chemotaxis response regulator CheB
MKGIVVIAASAGGLDPLRSIVAALPVPCQAAVFVVMHIGPYRSYLPALLNATGPVLAAFAQDGAFIEAARIYVAPPDHHLLIGAANMRLSQGAKVHHTRPAADPMFISAAETWGKRVTGIVLSGGAGDGTAGLLAIWKHGGTTFVQDPLEAAEPSMPRSAIMKDHPDACLPAHEIAQRVRQLCA